MVLKPLVSGVLNPSIPLQSLTVVIVIVIYTAAGIVTPNGVYTLTPVVPYTAQF